MAINYTVSYTFSPSTTISSSQVNTNFSDNSNTWNGVEAKTKTFSNLGVDTELKSAGTIKSADGTAAAPGYTFTSNTAVGLSLSSSSMSAIGLNALRYRRPVLQYASATTVTIESGLDGTSGNIPILFTDGSLRTETTSTRTTFDITRNAVLVTSGAQSGLTGATSEATNTWYALYACKVTDSTTLWVTVGSTVLPLQANYATLNTAYGTNGWVYLGLIRNGDNAGTTGDILEFSMSGDCTAFRNLSTAGNGIPGTRLATAAATTITWAYAGGTGAAQVPQNISICDAYCSCSGYVGDQRIYFEDASADPVLESFTGVASAATNARISNVSVLNGFRAENGAGASTTWYLNLSAFRDTVLGVGTNPLL